VGDSILLAIEHALKAGDEVAGAVRSLLESRPIAAGAFPG
jgi:hypothetical protein